MPLYGRGESPQLRLITQHFPALERIWLPQPGWGTDLSPPAARPPRRAALTELALCSYRHRTVASRVSLRRSMSHGAERPRPRPRA
jgi:hypothetical protein